MRAESRFLLERSVIRVLDTPQNTRDHGSYLFRGLYLHLFLTAQRQPNVEMLAVDQYHVCRVRGIQALTFVLSRGVAALFGCEHRGRTKEAAARFQAPFCVLCRAKGHHRGEYEEFRFGL
ncbi:hypothetical protein V5799_018725 [Amblyomma americanum]|uniref:Uncharacterized protein n=1 Tax=Amblyomma americanum TaxID=6943 RepID=A0AAQ4EZH1_AMBAM